MKAETIRKSSVIAAAFFACIIIRVFFELQYYGPESAIRRFYQAIRVHDYVAVQQFSAEPLQGAKVRKLLETMQSWSDAGVTLQVDRIERTGNEVRAGVVFTFPTGEITALVWVVQRRGKLWLVDVDKTATIQWDASR